ncbi:MAG TPA: RluA family pseudouridine synthase [bacterium]|nr:RluA family pseudouridine synthase [bacterium]
MFIEENINIIYLDDSIIAVNKPAGLLSIPDGYDKNKICLSKIIEKKFGKVFIVHRLDKQTSGIILFARNSESHRFLNILMEKREVNKEYHAIIKGNPEWDKKTITLKLRKNGDKKHRTIIDEVKGKQAETEIIVLERYSDYTLIAAIPKTGYTHQIRVHLSAIDFPILCDDLYNPFYTQQDVINRLALHSFSITFIHPLTRNILKLKADYPADFFRILKPPT